MLIGVPGRMCPLHDHPSDYWRFMPNGVVSMFGRFVIFLLLMNLMMKHICGGGKYDKCRSTIIVGNILG